MNHKTIGFTPKKHDGKLSRVRRLADADDSCPLASPSCATRLAAWDTRPRALCPKTPATPSRPHPCAVTGSLGWLRPGYHVLRARRHRAGRCGSAGGLAGAAGIPAFASKGSSQGYAGSAASTVLGSAAFAGTSTSSSRLCPSLPEGLYVGLDGGMNFASKLKTKDDFATSVLNPALTAFAAVGVNPTQFAASTQLDLSAKPGYQMGLSVGYRLPKSLYSFSDKVAFRVQASFLHQSIDYRKKDITLKSANAADANTYTLGVDSTSLSTLSVLGGLYADIHCTSDIDFTLGLNAGWSHTRFQTRMDGYSVNPAAFELKMLSADVSSHSNKLLLSLVAGPTLRLGEAATLGLNYRLTWMPSPSYDVTIDNRDGNKTLNRKSSVKFSHLMTHGVEAAFQISL